MPKNSFDSRIWVLSCFVAGVSIRRLMSDKRNKVLIIDDDGDFVSLLSKRLESHGFEVFVAGTAKEGLAALERVRPSVALLDVRLPDRSGVELVSEIREADADVPVIMVSGMGEPSLVVSAMQAGAVDYVQKPIDDREIVGKIRKAAELFRGISLEKELSSGGAIIGRSAQTQRLIRDISKVADSDAPVLLHGESGTGKTLVAGLIHSHSPRRERPFVTINCPAIPESLLESELFGHEKGAFTGAVREKIGKFELADGGTVFLDEIGDLPLELQVKILRVLQNGEFERVGGLKTIRVNVRIVAATNRNLEEAIRERRFREDLFYRLSVLPLYLPPLRERREDIPLLAEHFFNYYCRKSRKRFDKLSNEIMERLIKADWPGNIRELQNVMERAVVLGREPRLRIEDFTVAGKPDLRAAEPAAAPSIKEMELRSLMRAIEAAGGNISRAAKALGVGRDTVYRRLKKYGVELKRS